MALTFKKLPYIYQWDYSSVFWNEPSRKPEILWKLHFVINLSKKLQVLTFTLFDADQTTLEMLTCGKGLLGLHTGVTRLWICIKNN